LVLASLEDTTAMTDPILQTDLTLAEIIQRLVRNLNPVRIYLFGSKARGDAGPDSDYDLMVLVADDESAARFRRRKEAYRVLRGTGVATDVLVWSVPNFESRLHVAASLPAAIHREGKLVYAA
jgi:predicted nucleotidyltransferase